MTGVPRVAVVGAGPRAAYALERLSTLGSRYSVPIPTVDVIAPGTDIGAGEIYTAGQPDYFRLNVASCAVNAWNVDNTSTGQSFDEWRHQFHPASLPDQFPPRALMGHYLAAVGSTVRARVPGTRIDAKVTAIKRADSSFTLNQDRDDEQSTRHYDEVLLAVGHASDWSGSLHHRWRGSLPLAQVYPATGLQRHSQEMGGGSDPLVVVRGAALTGLDAALCLTQPGQRSARVLMVGRSGKPMAPKTDPKVLDALGDLGWLTEPGALALHNDESNVAHVVTDTAIRILRSALGGRGSQSGASSAVTAAVVDMFGPASDPPKRWLRHRLAISKGEATADGAWALGQAWKLLYPDLVSRQRRPAHLDGPPLGWADYRQWSHELERLAFGPPPVSVEALLALMDEQRVDIVGATEPIEQLAVDRGASLVVDAVLAPPGIRALNDPLVSQLTACGLLSAATHGRGARVDLDATCLDATAQRVSGLAAVGRITEDVVLGNDTLVRTMHPELDRWARRVLGIRCDVDVIGGDDDSSGGGQT